MGAVKQNSSFENFKILIAAYQPKDSILSILSNLTSHMRQNPLSLMGEVRNIFAVNVGRYTKTAPEQRIAFASAKSIWDEATQRLLAV